MEAKDLFPIPQSPNWLKIKESIEKRAGLTAGYLRHEVTSGAEPEVCAIGSLMLDASLSNLSKEVNWVTLGGAQVRIQDWETHLEECNVREKIIELLSYGLFGTVLTVSGSQLVIYTNDEGSRIVSLNDTLKCSNQDRKEAVLLHIQNRLNDPS